MVERRAAQKATLKSKAVRRHTDTELKAWADEQRRLYHAGTLSKWKIARLERVPGWTWGVA